MCSSGVQFHGRLPVVTITTPVPLAGVSILDTILVSIRPIRDTGWLPENVVIVSAFARLPVRLSGVLASWSPRKNVERLGDSSHRRHERMPYCRTSCDFDDGAPLDDHIPTRRKQEAKKDENAHHMCSFQQFLLVTTEWL